MPALIYFIAAPPSGGGTDLFEVMISGL